MLAYGDTQCRMASSSPFDEGGTVFIWRSASTGHDTLMSCQAHTYVACQMKALFLVKFVSMAYNISAPFAGVALSACARPISAWL